MADIVDEKVQIQQEETAPQAACSEGMFTRVGGAINFINNRQFDTIDFKINGPYNLSDMPQLQFDGLVTFPFAFEVVYASIYTGPVAASGGTTQLDVKWKPRGSGSYATIFGTKPAFTNAAGVSDLCSNGQSLTGFTAPTLVKTNFDAWDLLKLDILSAVTGDQEGCGLKLFWRPR